MKLLIVDDNVQNNDMLRTLLVGHGHDVLMAANGAEALETARKNRPDMIVADILMPVMDGYALCREWKQDDRLKAIPFVFYSATYTDPKDEEFGLSLGAERFIRKPAEPDEFLAMIAEVVAEKKAGRREAPNAPPENGVTFYKQYNQTLIRKLEKKVLELEAANEAQKQELLRRQAVELKLHKNEVFLRTLIDTIPELVWLKDPEGVFLACNHSFEQLFGAAGAEVAGKTDYDFVEKELADTMRENDRAAMDAGPGGVIEEKIEFETSGVHHFMEATKTAMYDDEGQLVGVLGIARDVSDRKRAEEALRQSEEKLALFIRHAPAAIAMFDRNMNYIACSQRWLKNFGLEGEEVLGRCHYDVFPDVPERWKEVHRKTLQGETLKCEEDQFPRANGSVDWVRWETHPWRTGRKEVGGILIFSEMITEQKLALEKMVASEMKFQTLAECAPVGIYLTDADGNCTYANRIWCETAGLTPEEAMGKGWLSGLLPEDRKSIEEKWHQSVESGGQWSFEYRFKDKTGRIAWAQGATAVLHDADGAVTGYVGCNIDITEQKQAAEENERLMAAVEQAAEIIMITDVHGSIQYTNPAFEQITGYARSEVLGKNPRILQSGRQDAAFYAEMWKRLSAGESWHGRLINKRKDGTFYTEETTISPIRNEDGAIVNYVGVKRDITAQLALEEQYRQAKKMEAVGQLAGGIAHDFNNILQSITGFCEIMEVSMDRYIAEHTDFAGNCITHREDVKEIKKAARLAAGLTSQLLAFSRKQPAAFRAIDLNTTLKDKRRLLRQSIDKGIKIRFVFSRQPLQIIGDSAQIMQIMMNLVLNARDAMPDGGEIVVSTAEIQIGANEVTGIAQSRPGKFACLSVSDTGTGMTRDQLTHIFEPFYTSKKVGEGTGLGLAVVYGVVQGHAGWINVSSAVGEGTTFQIYLPVVGEQPANEEELAGRRILLVEDDSIVLNMAGEILQTAGYEVSMVTTAQAAEELFALQDGAFDLLFFDVMLPDGNGIELAETLLAKKGSRLPVLLFSGYAEEEINVERIAENGFLFMEKPISLNKIMDSVTRALHDVRVRAGGDGS